MKMMKSIVAAAGIMMAVALAVPSASMAQARSYTPGTVWEVSEINVLPGQGENYADYLATTWKRVQELGKREGMVMDYHVLAATHGAANEADLVLVIVYKDFMTTAQQEAMSVKVNAMLAQTDRTAATASAARGPMRELLGTSQYQEMILK